MVTKMTMIDKTNGNILYKPFFPMSAMMTANNKDYEKMLEGHISAEMYIMKNGVSVEKYNEFAEWEKELNPEDLKYYNFICQARRICLYDFWEELKAEWKRTNDWRSLRPDQFLKKTTFSNVDYNEWSW